ncbi:MAG: B12-binding domain-containing radical SAM protein [Bryobacteraceae bacterium]
MVDVLLAHSNHIYNDRKQTEKMQPYPPLQTMMAASLLRDAGYVVEFCDVTFDAPLEKIRRSVQQRRPRLLAVYEDGFNFLNKMCLSRNREVAYAMAQVARSEDIKAAVHGPDASDHVREYLKAGFDYVLLGEGEPTLLELAQERPPAAIAGLAFFDDDGQVQYTGRRELLKHLDAFPPAAWDLIDVEQYRAAWQAKHGFFSLNMVSSRGCPFRCNWCAKPVYGDTYRVRNPRLVAEEVLYLKQSFRPDHIWFADDIFSISNRWTAEFTNAIEEFQAQTPFKMQSRCDLMTRNTVAALKRSGCSEVWMGAESGSQRVLDAMDKGIRVHHIHDARKNLAQFGIRCCFFLQFGYPGEGWDEIQETVRMIREAKPDDIGVSVSYPLPGTKFFQLVSNQMGRKANWSESGDLSMMFRGAFSSEFYRALAAALHLEVREPWRADSVQCAWDQVEQMRACTGHASEACA